MKYNLGILGLGEGRSAMSAALNSEKYELKTICDANMDLCKQREKEFDFHQYTTNYQEMLNDAENRCNCYLYSRPFACGTY